MNDPPAPLAPGARPLADIDLVIITWSDRVGDGLVYDGVLDGRAVRIREYAPAGIVRRRDDGGLEPADPLFADALHAATVRFLAHGRALAGLSHPAIAPILRAEAGENGTAYLVGAPIGETLADQLAAGLVLPPGQITRLGAELAEILAWLHPRGLVHLDIAPETVSLASGRLQLADFAVDNRRFLPLLGTQEGLVRRGYAGIEHSDADMADPLGPAADVHAACALLFRLMAGREPPAWQERWRDAAGGLPDLPSFSPAFLAAVRTGMAIEPGDRFADGVAWREALVSALAEPAEPPRPITAPPPPPPPPLPAKAPTRRWLLPALLLALLAAAATLGYFAVRDGWFAAKPTAPTNVAANQATPKVPQPAPTPPPPRPPANEVPLVRPGDSVAGRLEESDRRRGSGQYEDIYAIDVPPGAESLDIRVSARDFDAIVTLTGPGFEEGNDDEDDRGTDSRLRTSVPRSGRYFISVSSYDRGEAGDYRLDVAVETQAPPAD